MTDVLIVSTEADAESVRVLADRHAELAGSLRLLTGATLDAARGSDIAAVGLARDRLVTWCRTELVPHLASVGDALHGVAASATAGRALVAALADDLAVLEVMVQEVEDAPDAVQVAATAQGMWQVVSAHLDRTDSLVVPIVAQVPGADLTSLVDDVLSQSPGAAPEQSGGCGSGDACGCGEASEAGHPELDATTIPHAIRHATVFGALDAVPVGGAMVLVAPHDPLPLLAQLEARSRGGFTVDYLQRGPEKWRLLLTRRH